MDRKPKRRTRERIIETSLRLFNDFGEPNVTTTVIADEMNISPGNLYYHFHNKDEILESIFVVFEREIEDTLAAPTRRPADVEDIWLFLHLLFEQIWKYRFFYRDLNDLLTRNRLLEIHFRQILAHKVRTATTLCESLVLAGAMRASSDELRALATNMTVIATYWLSYEYAIDPRGKLESGRIGRGVYQAMAMLSPFLVGESKGLLDRLSQEYLAA
ncbi:MAG: DNA-binding transcriptional repressor AcrR [Candidatus Accumulibacter sp. BA-94]|uniref:TetR/AcrR family transcriptional regulator n=1 Tax=Accumulibacter sp. TaxID=2053492 RepID=UPI00044B7BB5|nr:TetR/AcrR family transcriptional regulator [Accumulibacter sp.]EXI83751.1 MAG: DNA-binding transcriptional repressor AcrR [Candidatus Accumulibacter sp. BA-94]MBL8390714.1 TetR family transcriptional regulator [Accumulibacter sp.]HRD87113.1 TetR/AcrR family transcriptional regulator [Accumulibacter sp.]